MPTGDDRETARPEQRSAEDLFEDLDKFFAPINEAEWTGEHELGAHAAEAPAAEGPAAEAPAPAGGPEPPEAVEAPSGTDLGEPDGAPAGEPGGPASRIPEGEQEAADARPPAEEPSGAPPVPDLRGLFGPEEPTTEWADADVAPEPGEPTGEMSGEDWRRLRDVLGAEGEEELAGPPFPGEGAEGPSELTLEDLKKAPPEYAHLPGAEVAAGAEAGAGLPEGWAGEPGAPEPGPEEPVIEEEDLLAALERVAEPRTVRVGAPESYAGPSWEEPTSQPVGAVTREAPPGERNMPMAILTGAVLVAVAVLSILVSKAAFAVVAGVVVAVAQAELYGTMQRKGGYQPATALGLVIGGLVMAAAYLRGENAMLLMLALGVVLSFAWYMAAPTKGREGTGKNVGATMLGVLYLPFMAGYLLVLLSQSWGRGLVLAVLGLTFFYDIAAFAFGSLWGRRPLAPTISPRKSWEGLFGATVVTLVLAVALLPSIHPVDPSMVRAVAMGLVIVVLAPLGDLAESLLKRDLGVKDMGTILPGHGGVLDRIDSVLFVAPGVLYLLRLIS